MTTPDLPTLQDRLETLRDAHGVPGASLAVLNDGRTSAVAAGILNLETDVEATVDSLFQIGSVTKVWTATLAMQLVDEGALDLDVPVRRYLPDFSVADDEVSRKVTSRHLLNHSSGIDGDHFAETGRGDDALERYVQSCSALRQVHPLGATMSYCNTGYSVLGRVIEVVTGNVWDEVLRERLVEPLGLTHTATLPEDVLRFRAAIGHIQPPGGPLQATPRWGLPRSSGPAGIICSTATDVIAFARLHIDDGRAHDGRQVVSSDSAQAMREREVVVPSGGIGQSPGHRGLGWAVSTWGTRTVLGHDGGTIGQYAFLRVVPDAGVAVALLTNGGNVTALFRDLCGDLLAELADVEMPAEPTPPPSRLDFDPAPYLGRYERETVSIDVVDRGGDMAAVQTITGLGSEMTPEPLELPLILLDAGEELFLARHPTLETWQPARFATLADGSRCMHVGGRATPRTG